MLLAIALIAAAAAAASLRVATAGGAGARIEHVVVFIQENHSFDNVLGRLCIQDARPGCDAADVGENEKGEKIPLSRARDRVINVGHDQGSQINAIDKGKMDGWERVGACYQNQCYTQYEPNQIPSLARLAREGAISDAFFSRGIVASWPAHLDFFAQTFDGFVFENPAHSMGAPNPGPGWGCDSNFDAMWLDPTSGKAVKVPSCIPDKQGRGPYRASPVPYVPTIADRLEEAGLTWGIYGAAKPKSVGRGYAYSWTICPTFAECLLGPQKGNFHHAQKFMADAKAGRLPNFSIVTPAANPHGAATSQHNETSMIQGDNYLGEAVAAVKAGADAQTTTIFIFYDDCGCFYDHVRPPKGLGIRLPLVIVSPYAKPGFTDHEVATDSSILAYMESVLNVKPVNEVDATAYNFHESFTSLASASKFEFHPAPIPASSRNLHETSEGT